MIDYWKMIIHSRYSISGVIIPSLKHLHAKAEWILYEKEDERVNENIENDD